MSRSGRLFSWAIPLLLLLLALALLLPLFSRGLPPGVDSPTFLHFVWLYHQSWLQAHSLTPADPYWYGGMDPFLTYSPLGFLATALPSAATGLDVVLVYKLWLLLAVATTGWAVYLLALEIGAGKRFAFVAALLTEVSYPLLSSIGLWGRFTTVLALPLALFSLLFLERTLRTGSLRWAALGGGLAAASVLVHHMTGFVLVTLLPFLLLTRPRPSLRMKALGIFAGVALAGSGGWVALFLREITRIGFEREVAGLWAFSGVRYLGAALDRGLINSYQYPSYFGIPLALLALWGLPLVLGEARGRGYVLGLAWLFALSLGRTTALGRLPGLDSLDAARFHLYMVPFAAIIAALGLERVVRMARGRLSSRTWRAALALPLAGLLVLAGADAYAARASLRPYQVTPEVAEILSWLKQEGKPGRIFSVGFWHWDAYLLPALAGRESVGGWYIEGAPRWREVRPLELMMYTGKVDLDNLWRTLAEFQARYVLVHYYNAAESPTAFDRALSQSPLFQLVRSTGTLRVYEVLPPLRN